VSNYLISKEQQELFKKHTGNDLEFINRRIGKTLAFAMRFISDAILSPGTPIQIYDHQGGCRDPRSAIIPEIEKVINGLQLKGLSIWFNRSPNNATLIFNLYEPNDKKIVE